MRIASDKFIGVLALAIVGLTLMMGVIVQSAVYPQRSREVLIIR